MTQGQYNSDGKPGPPGHGRLDKIYLSKDISTAVDSRFTTFVGKSNHKAVVLSMGPKGPPGTGMRPRLYCPTSFPVNWEMGQAISQQLESIQDIGTQWWDTAWGVIRSKALRFHAAVPKQPRAGEAKLLALLHKSTPYKVPREACATLETHGYTPTSPASTYSMLVHLYELVEKDPRERQCWVG